MLKMQDWSLFIARLPVDLAQNILKFVVAEYQFYGNGKSLFHVENDDELSPSSKSGHGGRLISSIRMRGNVIASGGWDQSVVLFEMRDESPTDASGLTLLKEGVLSGNRSLVSSVAITEDGGVIVSGGFDKSVHYWSRRDGNVDHVLHGHPGKVLCVDVHQETIISADSEGKMLVWNIGDGIFSNRLEHSCAITACAISGKWIISGGQDGSITIWRRYNQNRNNRNPRLFKTIAGAHADKITSALIVEEGETKEIITSSADRSAGVWDLKTGRLKHRLVGGHTKAILQIARSKNSIFTMGQDHTVCIWDAKKFHLTQRIISEAPVSTIFVRDPDGASSTPPCQPHQYGDDHVDLKRHQLEHEQEQLFIVSKEDHVQIYNLELHHLITSLRAQQS